MLIIKIGLMLSEVGRVQSHHADYHQDEHDGHSLDGQVGAFDVGDADGRWMEGDMS